MGNVSSLITPQHRAGIFFIFCNVGLSEYVCLSLSSSSCMCVCVCVCVCVWAREQACVRACVCGGCVCGCMYVVWCVCVRERVE